MSSDWRKTNPSGGVKLQKSVRFTVSETTRELLDKPTWRRLPPIQEVAYVMSTQARRGQATIKFLISKMLFVRLPTTRRVELEMYCARLLSTKQLAAWWSQLSPSNRSLLKDPPGKSITEIAFSFCEVMAEISERHGNKLVTDTLSPLVVPVISSWEQSGEIANVDDTNTAAEAAAKGKKAGNALGEARSRCYKEFEKRKAHYDTFRDSDLELKQAEKFTRFLTSCTPLHGANIQEFKISLITNVRGKEKYDQEVLGVGMSSQVVVARELAAEQALANWHICEAIYQGIAEPYQTVVESPKPLRKRDKSRAGKPSKDLKELANMFASPAPSAARARRAAQPAARQSQTSRRTSAAIRASTSRLTTPAIRGAYGHGSPSVEDQDMASEASFGTVTASEAAGHATYVKTPELTVMFGGHFPEEVRRTLGSSEVNRNASTGMVDHTTGYAFLVTYDTCFVWNPTKRSHGSPTCYIFPTPRQQASAGAASHLMLPNVSLIPYGSSREPGLVMIASTGEIRLWESINAGLAGAEQFYSNSVPLSAGEYVSTMHRSE
ncbi:hypothetical protein FRC09_015237, partial [Ceratobasidium sp. 395]